MLRNVTQTQTVLEFSNVVRSYPGEVPVQAVDGVSFRLDRGAFAAVLGPSGSGKTTLLNLASGLDQADSGRIMIAGREVNQLGQTALCEFRRRHLGFIFQAYNLFPVLSAVENVEFTSLIRGDDASQARARAEEALRLVGLSHKLGARPSQLSGGQQQRVAVARALASQPDIIFADEPTANLDSKTAISLIELFEKLNAELGVTFFFSTHDQKLADRVKTRLEMCDGKLLNGAEIASPRSINARSPLESAPSFTS
jgi:putative ABC transport system ATP-binding protein